MLIFKNVEDLKTLENGDVIVDKDGVVFQTGNSEFFCPGDTRVFTAEDVVFPALKVYPLEVSGDKLISHKYGNIEALEEIA